MTCEVLFRRKYDSAPRVDAWFTIGKRCTKLPHKAILPKPTGFVLTAHFNHPNGAWGAPVHWIAYSEPPSNEKFNVVMQTILTSPARLTKDIADKLEDLEKAGFLHLTDLNGQNLLHASAYAGNLEVLELLVSKGLDIECTDQQGWTPLFSAVNPGNLHCAIALLGHGATACIYTTMNGSPLHYLMRLSLVEENKREIMSLLGQFIKSGIDVNRADDAGETPLSYLCSKHGNLGAAGALLVAGADPNKAGRRGITPLHIAVLRGNPALVKLLLEHGADPQRQSKHGTPRSMAYRSSNEEVVRIFEGELFPPFARAPRRLFPHFPTPEIPLVLVIPARILSNILFRLPPPDVASAALVCRNFNKAARAVLMSPRYWASRGMTRAEFARDKGLEMKLRLIAERASEGMDAWKTPPLPHLTGEETVPSTLEELLDSKSPYNFFLRLIVIGSTAAGKSSFVTHMRNGKWPEMPVPDRVEFVLSSHGCLGKLLRLQLFDAWCQEYDVFKNSDTRLFRTARGVLIFYDITSREQWKDMPNWQAEVRRWCRPDAKVMLVGSKADLEAQRAVTLADAAEFAATWMAQEPSREVFSIEISTKTGKNIDICLKFLCEQIIRSLTEMESPVVLEMSQKKSDKACLLM